MAERQNISEATNDADPLTTAEQVTLDTLRDGRLGHPLQQKQDERLDDLLRRERRYRTGRQGATLVGLIVLLAILVLAAWLFGLVFFNVAAIAAK